MVNAALADSGDGRGFVSAEPSSQDGCFIFGLVDQIMQFSPRYDATFETTDKSDVVHVQAMMPLDEFVSSNRWDVIREAFGECDPDTPPNELVRLRNGRGKTPLHTFLHEVGGNRGDVQIMIDAGANINATDHCGNTVLHTVDRLDDLQMLLEAGANPAIHNLDGLTVLHIAAERGKQEHIQELLSHGMCIDVQTIEPRESERPWSFGERMRARKHGAQHRQLRSGQTPLHRAAFEGKKSVVLLLMALGADARIEDSQGHTPEDLARLGGHADMTPFC